MPIESFDPEYLAASSTYPQRGQRVTRKQWYERIDAAQTQGFLHGLVTGFVAGIIVASLFAIAILI